LLRYVGQGVAAVLALLCAACAGSVAPPATMSGDAPALVESNYARECAAYARERSGIALYGDAYTWWDQAQGHYGRESAPQPGAVLVLTGYAGPKRGHLAVVTRIVAPREIRVDHANWLNDGNLYLNTPVIDVSPANDWSEVRVWNTREGHLGGNTYAVQGFIAPFAAPHEITAASGGPAF
jgi:surface antigen